MSLANPVFIPGPTNLPDSVRRAIDLPTVDHRSPAFAETLPHLFGRLKKIFRTKHAKVFIFPGTGTGGWEATIANTLSRGDRILACRHGVFSDKWIKLCQNFGLIVDIIDCDWRGPADPNRIEDILRADTGKQIKAVLATHNETATGVRSDLAAIRDAIDAAGSDALFFVDGVSSIASIDFRMDEWGVDAAVTGSQKGLMLPAGLAIVALSERAQQAGHTAGLPRFFFDCNQMGQMTAAGGFPYTPPMQLLSGLDQLWTCSWQRVSIRFSVATSRWPRACVRRPRHGTSSFAARIYNLRLTRSPRYWSLKGLMVTSSSVMPTAVTACRSA